MIDRLTGRRLHGQLHRTQSTEETWLTRARSEIQQIPIFVQLAAWESMHHYILTIDILTLLLVATNLS